MKRRLAVIVMRSSGCGAVDPVFVRHEGEDVVTSAFIGAPPESLESQVGICVRRMNEIRQTVRKTVISDRHCKSLF